MLLDRYPQSLKRMSRKEVTKVEVRPVGARCKDIFHLHISGGLRIPTEDSVSGENKSEEQGPSHLRDLSAAIARMKDYYPWRN